MQTIKLSKQSINIDEIQRDVYAQCVIDTFNEFNYITSKTNNDMQSVIYYAHNNVKIFKDVEEVNNKIMFLLDNTKESVDRMRIRYLNNYELWLKTYLNLNTDISRLKISNTNVENKEKSNAYIKCVNTVDLENSYSSDPEIVNETNYLNSHQEITYIKLENNESVIKEEENNDYDIINDNELDIVEHKVSPLTLESISGNIEEIVDNGSLLMSDSDSIIQINNNENEKDVQFIKTEFDDKLMDIDLNKSLENINKEYVQNEADKIALDDCKEEITLIEPPKSDSNISITENITDKFDELKSNSNSEQLILNENNTIEPNTALNNLETETYLSDKKLQSECTTQLERLSNSVLNENKKKLFDTKSSKDKEFLRVIDVDGLEKKNKRCYNSDTSDTSKSSTSNTSSKVFKKKHKRCRKLEIDSEIESVYSSAGSIIAKDNDDQSDIFEFNELEWETYNNHEEILKEHLKKNGLCSFKDYDIDIGDHEYYEDHEVKTYKRKPKRKDIEIVDYMESSSSENEKNEKNKKNEKNEKNEKNDRSKWLKDDVLKFKLADSPNDKKNSSMPIKKIFAKTNDNITELISTEKKKIVENLAKAHSGSDSDNCLDIQSVHLSNSNESLIDDGQISESSNESNDIIPNVYQLNNSSKLLGKSFGRRNIRKLLEDQQVADDTKQAGKDEEIRFQRIVKHNTELDELLKEERRKNKGTVILDYNPDTKEILTVDQGLVKYLKPHQANGVKFMWDSCFETLERCKTSEGSGCILAHCMGLGKTFQIITLAHTLLVNKLTGVKTIMIICPMNTILNWIDEFDNWIKRAKNKKKINIYELTQKRKVTSKLSQLDSWHKHGGVLIISYEMFRFFLTCEKKLNEIELEKMKLYLISPGADLVVCDEGHFLKNEISLLVFKLQQVKTKRRIILTGTPLQNNLSEYHCMVQFVKPNLLGTNMEFINRFNNPIINGQFDNSTPEDVKLMKHRAHVLHRMLKSCVQRCDYTVLRPFLPVKQEYVILIRLSELQMKLYRHYVNNFISVNDKNCSIFKNYHEIKRLVSHPMTMALKEQTTVNRSQEFQSEDELEDNLNYSIPPDIWWARFISQEDLTDITISYKLIILFSILEQCQREGDKLLVFSQCLCVLKTIQKFLDKINSDSNLNPKLSNLFTFQGQWKYGRDYFQLDGSVNSSKRNAMCKKFNDPTNKRARLFLISTKAGGLGINLIGANRVVIFDPSWNPFNDVQSIFRVFRFGQKKPCYIYRFLTAGTMEQKIYNRQVTKLSLSLRVLDEKQIERHYRDTDLTELYKFEPIIDDVPALHLPRDHVLANVFFKYRKCIYKFFEHDSLLENKEEEELDEDERKQAWLEYQQEKKLSYQKK